MATDLTKINKDSLTSIAYQQIKEAIMSGHFQPGEQLAMRTLAKKMGTSITPVREALCCWPILKTWNRDQTIKPDWS